MHPYLLFQERTIFDSSTLLMIIEDNHISFGNAFTAYMHVVSKLDILLRCRKCCTEAVEALQGYALNASVLW